MELSPLINTLIDIGMWTCFVLFGLALVALVGFALLQLVLQFIHNPKKALMTVATFVALLVIFFVAYFLSSSSDISSIVYEKTDTPESWGRWIGAGLFTTYFFFGLAIVSLATVEIIRPFKK